MEFCRNINFAVDVVKIVVPDDTVHFCGICFSCAPFKVKNGTVIYGEVSESNVLLPLGGTTDLTIKGVIGLFAIDKLVRFGVDWLETWGIHPVRTFKLEHWFGNVGRDFRFG